MPKVKTARVPGIKLSGRRLAGFGSNPQAPLDEKIHLTRGTEMTQHVLGGGRASKGRAGPSRPRGCQSRIRHPLSPIVGTGFVTSGVELLGGPQEIAKATVHTLSKPKRSSIPSGSKPSCASSTICFTRTSANEIDPCIYQKPFICWSPAVIAAAGMSGAIRERQR